MLFRPDSEMDFINNTNQTVQDCVSRLQDEFDVLDIIYCDDLSMFDLYIKIKNLYKESYNNDQRIIFVMTKDTGVSSTAGLILQNLQLAINDIDISNFFVCLVTTNPNINVEYQYILDNISHDKIPLHIYQCQGVYNIINDAGIDIFSKYSSIKHEAEKIKELNLKQQKLLFESKTFCMMPWAGINIEPDNRVRPCCEFDQSLGDCSKDSLETIWNSEQWKKVRKDMLDGVPIKACDKCYQKEKMGRDTLRKSTNRLLFDNIDLVEQTSNDGHLSEFKLGYWDIRYNNLCNLTCRSCTPNLSSSWYHVSSALGKIKTPRSPIMIAGSNNLNIFDQIVSHINHVKQIYFAGGEPSMIDKFYHILELLDSAGRNDVQLCYNINMSRLSLKDKSLLTLWKKFPNVSVGASLDGEYQRGEYIRQGLVWDDVITNRRKIQEECPHVDFYISATVSVLNVLHLPDFHKSWVDLGLIAPQDFNLQILFWPDYLRVDRVPSSMKEKIKQSLNDHLDWLVPRDPLGRATYGFRSILSYIENDSQFDTQQFWHNVSLLDEYHHTNMLSVFPELDILLKSE